MKKLEAMRRDLLVLLLVAGLAWIFVFDFCVTWDALIAAPFARKDALAAAFALLNIGGTSMLLFLSIVGPRLDYYGFDLLSA